MHMQIAATNERAKARMCTDYAWLVLETWHGEAVHACYFSTIKNKKIIFNIQDIGAMVQLFGTLI